MELPVNKDQMIDELLSDMLASLGDEEEPCQEDGWIGITSLLQSSRGLSINQIRARANQSVASGKWEKKIYKKNIYYRVKVLDV